MDDINKVSRTSRVVSLLIHLLLILPCHETLGLSLVKVVSQNFYRGSTRGYAVLCGLSSILFCTPTIEPVNAKALLYDSSGKPSIIQQSKLDDQTYRKPIFNLPPSEQEFPSYYKGLWDCEYRYSSAEFSDKVQFQSLQRDPNVAGFRKFSVAYMPDIGKDVKTTSKYSL